MEHYEKQYTEESGKPAIHNYGLEVQYTEGYVKWLCKRLEKAEKENFKENLLLDRAITQMNVLNVVMPNGGMDVDEAIVQLSLADIKYVKLARENNLYYIASRIEEHLNRY